MRVSASSRFMQYPGLPPIPVKLVIPFEVKEDGTEVRLHNVVCVDTVVGEVEEVQFDNEGSDFKRILKDSDGHPIHKVRKGHFVVKLAEEAAQVLGCDPALLPPKGCPLQEEKISLVATLSGVGKT